MNIDPTRDFPALLMAVDNPGRYVGGEFGALRDSDPRDLTIALCFPDLYEIGMSNNAVRILYALLNGIPGVRCERVFAPAPDFEQVLQAHDIPLYTLESGTPVSDFDILAFSVGYELSATGILSVLDRAGVGLHNHERSNADPIVIAGGPALTNPLPFEGFIDAFFIGEAEGALESIVTEARSRKSAGGSRGDLLEAFLSNRSVYYSGKKATIKRAVWGDFGTRSLLDHPPVVPSIRVVQDHGVVEIMRGCPNGCRFCHAGIYYRPYRMKDPRLIVSETEVLVQEAGYRHVTLSSLSSADYADVGGLIRDLNHRFHDHRVSFALPSLRVDSVSLDLLEQVASVRKSGLTFAVETPRDADQLGLNKTVNREGLIDLLRRAKSHGWRVAKFYFMIGLPNVDWEFQVDQIEEYLREIRSAVKLQLNVNAATFVPKPHTPFQWAPQMSEEDSLADLSELKRRLKRIGIKLSYASPFHSLLEGIISRGDERVGQLIENAYHGGSRLDAWDDYFRRDVWNQVLDDAPWPVRTEAIQGREPESRLPWDSISLGTSRRFLLAEYRRSQESRLLSHCAPECRHHCGVCNSSHPVRDLGAEPPIARELDTGPGRSGPYPSGPPATEPPPKVPSSTEPALAGSSTTEVPSSATSEPATTRAFRITFCFSRSRSATFIPHLATMGVFERSLQRAGIPVAYTAGYNPKPKLEFAQPLSLGIASNSEIAAVDVLEAVDLTTFVQEVNAVLPEGFRVSNANRESWEHGARAPDSLMSRYWGSKYEMQLHHGPTLHRETPPLAELAGTLSVTPGVHNLVLTENSVLFDLESDAGRFPGVKTLLAKTLGCHPVEAGLTITRLETFAKDESGRPSPYLA